MGKNKNFLKAIWERSLNVATNQVNTPLHRVWEKPITGLSMT